MSCQTHAFQEREAAYNVLFAKLSHVTFTPADIRLQHLYRLPGGSGSREQRPGDRGGDAVGGCRLT
ncbi:MAG TPA: hypothetical protein VEU96_09760 [Bryobacteraceae bacterium]|nr:hypothetical protein [Bryobacteraceae bacterium]